jgi:hypothetical protein
VQHTSPISRVRQNLPTKVKANGRAQTMAAKSAVAKVKVRLTPTLLTPCHPQTKGFNQNSL